MDTVAVVPATIAAGVITISPAAAPMNTVAVAPASITFGDITISPPAAPMHLVAVNPAEITIDQTIAPAAAAMHLVAIVPGIVKGGDPQTNATALRAVLDGVPGAYRDITLLNAAAALVVAERAETLAEGVRQAAVAVDSGKARAALEKLVAISNQGATP